MKPTIDNNNETKLNIGYIIKPKCEEHRTDTYMVVRRITSTPYKFTLMNIRDDSYVFDGYESLIKLEKSIDRNIYNIYSPNNYISKLLSR
ncbi:hypothetical protein [Clostridioides difficile]|uniref:hypothetical protein n=1 Tax=Clostridioides difficile TaxID=1496 RepID=UPI0020C526C1|nr:hypothetical protein [Clostridioides difficile]MCP8386794.1 hypothetical protein [Clostridioides difficile]HCQ5967558.1 hypothetical protein [Clostridioides difficile]